MLSDTEGEAAARAARGGTADREGGLHLAYDKWSKLEITDDGDVVERIPASVEKALGTLSLLLAFLVHQYKY